MTKHSPATLLVALMVLAAVLLSAAPAGASDASSTQTYIQANYTLLRVGKSHLAVSEAAPHHVLAQVRAECPLVAASSPQDPESTELSNEVIGAMVLSAGQPDRAAIRSFVKTVSGLRWSNGGLTRAIHTYVSKLRILLGLAVPALCSDVRAWVSSGFKTLPGTTVQFDAKFMPAWVSLGELPKALARYETPSEKAIARLSNHIEEVITEAEAREVETWGSIMDAMVLQP